MRTAIIGGGKGCKAILEMILRMRLVVLSPEVIAVVDPDPQAPGLVMAREQGWPTYASIEEALALPGLELVIEVVGREEAVQRINELKPPRVRLIDHVVARVFWDMELLLSQLEKQLDAAADLKEQLGRDRDQLQQILNALPDAVLVLDKENRLQRINARAPEIPGLGTEVLEPGRLFTDPFSEYDPQSGISRSSSHIDDVRRTGDPKSLIHFCGEDQGRQRYCRIMVNPIFGPGGQVDLVVETVRDITEQVEQARETEESERRFRQFVDNAHDLIVIKDPEGRYLVINEPAAGLFGMSPMDCLGRTDREIFPGRLAEVLRAKDEQTLAKREYASDEDSLVINGQRRYFHSVRFPLFDYKGDLSGVGSISREITEEKKLQGAVIQSEKLAAVGKLAASVAHEINNPLTGVLTFAEEIKMDLAEDDPLTTDLDVIIRETMRCRQIVANLLDYARVEPPRRRYSDVNEIVDKSRRLVQKQALFHDVAFEVDLAAGLPPVEADPNQLQQVFLNLIINAGDAMNKRGRITITSRPADRGRAVAVTVTDRGPGVSEEVRARIFEPFYSTKGDQGNGLGLHVVKTIVEQHHGSVELDSRPGQGAAFTVTLPAVVDNAADRQGGDHD